MVSPLNRKLLRDLWRIKGQAVAIGLVLAVGVMMLVMMTGLVASLDETRRAYYERHRFAEVFAPVKRAPQRLVHDLSAIPGVASVEGRVTGHALVHVKGRDLPVQAQTVSLPDFGEPRLNDIYLSDGRKLDSRRANEILLLRSFALAHNLQPGDKLSATMNGARRSFQIVGLAQSPEFLYTTAPGELVPDDSRFGVIWMSRTALEAAYDMEGAFNGALLSLGRDANKSAVINDVDQLLEPYGGLGAYGREDQVSNRFVSEEIAGLRATSTGVPPVFLAVAAFLLYIVVARMVQAERNQIGLLQAFGYTNLEVGVHYFKLILVISFGGAIAGCLMGIASGRAMTGLYVEYYKFPFLVFQVTPSSFALGLAVSVATASVGGLVILRRVFDLTPASAMRPPVPPDYSRSGRVGQTLNAFLDQPSRMVLRRVTRQARRMAGAVLGISAGMALSVAMASIMSGFDRTVDLTFSVVDRSDVTVTFNQPMSNKVLLELRRMEGVIEVEPVRNVPVVFRNGVKTHRGAVNGLVSTPLLYRALDHNATAIDVRNDGVILAQSLADKLNIQPGEQLTIDVREGRRPTLTIPVAGVARSLLGSPAYMNLNSLNHALGEPNRVSGAYLRIDAVRSGEVYRKLKNMPSVAGVGLKEEGRAAFQRIMDSGAGAIRYIMAAIAGVITFGIVYNAASIAYAERTRDLASLRVIGFSNSETAFVLLGELAVVTLLALPVGSVLGYWLTFVVATGFSTDLYQIPATFDPECYGIAALTVLAAAFVSGWLVKRSMDRADLISALKTRE